jgi:hypothetical protein
LPSGLQETPPIYVEVEGYKLMGLLSIVPVTEYTKRPPGALLVVPAAKNFPSGLHATVFNVPIAAVMGLPKPTPFQEFIYTFVPDGFDVPANSNCASGLQATEETDVVVTIIVEVPAKVWPFHVYADSAVAVPAAICCLSELQATVLTVVFATSFDAVNDIDCPFHE